MIIEWLWVFIAMFATDVCWALYVRRTKDGNAFAAANWAVLLFVTGAVATITYVKDPWLLIPAMVGAWLGTFATIWWDEFKTLLLRDRE